MSFILHMPPRYSKSWEFYAPGFKRLLRTLPVNIMRIIPSTIMNGKATPASRPRIGSSVFVCRTDKSKIRHILNAAERDESIYAYGPLEHSTLARYLCHGFLDLIMATQLSAVRL